MVFAGEEDVNCLRIERAGTKSNWSSKKRSVKSRFCYLFSVFDFHKVSQQTSLHTEARVIVDVKVVGVKDMGRSSVVAFFPKNVMAMSRVVRMAVLQCRPPRPSTGNYGLDRIARRKNDFAL